MHFRGATAEGTRRFRSRFPQHAGAEFFRPAQEWCVSSLGIGTYLGGADEPTDQAYADSVAAAAHAGINVIDTAINYRHQRSERSIKAALGRLGRDGIAREQLVICTKAGFAVPGAVPAGLGEGDVAGGIHSMAPLFLADQIERSRANLGLDTLDVFYLHNPETQLNFVKREEFEARLARAFAFLETLVARGTIRYYGVATWHAFRRPPGASDGLSLARVTEIARREGDGFRFVQLPLNLAMPEAFTLKPETLDGRPRSVLEAAGELGITVVASATLMQARLARTLPEQLESAIPGELTAAQRAIQFTRSTPGIAVALVGMSDAAHVRENAGIAAVAPMPEERFLRLFQPA